MKTIAVPAVLCLAIAAAAPCWGQQSSLFGSGSSGGRSSGGQSGSSGLGAAGAAAGNALGGVGTTRGMSGSGTGGRQTNSSTGGVQQPQFNSFGSVGNSIGQGSFVGRSDNTGRFVGQTQGGGQQGAQGGMGLGRTGGGRNGNANGNSNNNNNFGNGGSNQQAQRRVRPQLKVAFPTPAVPTTAIASTLQHRLSTETLTAGSLKNVNLTMEEGGVVTLRGEVANPDAKSLAAAMVRLEPGVRKVVNELTVAQ